MPEALPKPSRPVESSKDRVAPAAHLLSFLLAVLLIPSCRGQDSPHVEESVDSSLPGPERAAAAASRVKPLLTPALAKQKLRIGDPVFLRAFKEEKELELWMQPGGTGKFVLFRTYPIAATSGKPGPKLAEGDRQVPEGFYYFSRRGLKPDSRFHLAMNIGYPNSYDRHHERTGSFIMIHGSYVSIGCLAMTDPKIEEIYTLCEAALSSGQPFVRVHLFPFRMTDEGMKRSADHKHLKFWENLKEGYDHFDKSAIPPNIVLEGGQYVVKSP